MTAKKRKRRSFWEPESEALVEWLESQTDLGTSLQLIIVDAINKYGDGDVIQSYLQKRETDALQGRNTARTEPKDEPILNENNAHEREPVREEPAPTTPKKVVVKGKRVEATPKEQSEQSRQAVQDTKPQKDEAVEQEPYNPNNSVLDALYKGAEELHRDAPVKEEPTRTEQKPKQVEKPSEDDYNPIDIMMGDIGSRMR